MYKLVKFLVLGAFLCSVIGCGKDDPDEPKKPDTPGTPGGTLLPAFVSVEASDASLLLSGDDATKDITLKANREVEVAVPAEAAEWLTVTAAATDLAASTAKLTITVKKNEAAYKGRAATVSITAKKANDDDNVSGASAKASIEIKQSLFGLPVADLFDWKADAAGNVSDVSANGLAITVGPAKPATTLNSAYGLYEATIEEVSSEKYPDDHALYPAGHPYNSQFETYASEKYQAADGEHGVEGKRMCYYKIPWATNAGIVDAYKSAFSYELIFQAPEYPDNANNNLFGNVNPTHCGFGINRHENTINFCYHYSFGGTDRLYHIDADSTRVTTDFAKYYHVVATYDKANPTESIVLYVDGVKVNSVGNPEGKSLHFPTDYYAMSTGHVHADDNYGSRTPQTEYLCIGGGSHQSGYPSFGAPHNTKVVVARVYGKALNPIEVSALYNYHKPE